MKFARSAASSIWRNPALHRGIIICVVLAILSSLAEVAVAISMLPILVSLGIDAGSELSGLVDVLPTGAWLVVFTAFALARSYLNWLSTIQTERGSQEFIVTLQSRLYTALASAHWDTIRRISPPKITSALQTQAYEAGFGISGIVRTASAALLILAYLISATALFPIILPGILVILVLMWRLNAGRTARIYEQSENYQDSQTELHQRYEDWVAISHVASLGIDTAGLTNRFERDAREAATHAIGFNRSFAATRVKYEMVVIAAILLGVPIAWWLDSPPALLVFGLVVLLRLMPQAGVLHVGYQGIVNASAPINNIEDLIARLEGDRIKDNATHPRLAWQKLVLDGIGVADDIRDDKSETILDDVDLSVEFGEWLAVTGPTGAGKTTLANVMLMLLRPSSGEIRIDDVPTDDALANRWRHQAAYVPQDVILFDATIRANVKLIAPDATDQDLETALRQSAAEFVFGSLPDGLDTRVGPGGRWLSGGERQRIGIARALLRKPGFLVLDEPTAALDSGTQERLMQALSGLDHKMSVVFITHRPELLALADRVVEIDGGRIARTYAGN